MSTTSNPSIEIIIPTLGGRQRYLADAIASCLAQPDQHLSILVSNNGGSPEVRALVRSIDDKRVRYIETDRLLPMPVHWDFALANSSADIVSIIGDDDALMPHAIESVARAFAAKPTLECITHRPGQYYWPDFLIEGYQNLFWIEGGCGELVIHQTKPILDEVARFTTWYGRLPFLYHGFVRRTAIERIRASQGGRVFLRAAPDVYSDLALAAVMDRFGVLDDCLTIGGQGARSTGINYSLNSEIGRQFLVDMPKDLMSEVSQHSIGLHLYEYLVKIREVYGISRNRPIVWRRFFGLVAREAVRSAGHRKEILDDLVRICGLEFSGDVVSFSKAVAAILDVDWVAEGLESILRAREKKVMSRWRNAVTEFGVKDRKSVV